MINYLWVLSIGEDHETPRRRFFSTEGKCYKALIGSLSDREIVGYDGDSIYELPYLEADHWQVYRLEAEA
jgi:hypothetical protein